jgi:nucleotide-binding universal stress UspA family protein
MDLVVLGAHSIGAPTTPVGGSTAAMVMEHATCPVAIVPTGES